ncbi:MAG: PDZ domain-containing protein [Acidobacteria bacterium]|nr:PDZ domain-containing protein [Acidobacteriota bacterium]
MRTLASMAILMALVSPAALAGDTMDCTLSTEECVQKLATELRDRGFLGVELDQAQEGEGMLVKKVVPGSPAAAAGFEIGDVLVAIGDVVFAADNKDAVTAAFHGARPGDLIRYKVERNGRERTLKARLAKMPEPIMAEWLETYRTKHAEQMAAAK